MNCDKCGQPLGYNHKCPAEQSITDKLLDLAIDSTGIEQTLDIASSAIEVTGEILGGLSSMFGDD